VIAADGRMNIAELLGRLAEGPAGQAADGAPRLLVAARGRPGRRRIATDLSGAQTAAVQRSTSSCTTSRPLRDRRGPYTVSAP